MEHFPIIERLHTDVLEEKYGLISAEIVDQSSDIRKIHLVDQDGISRTFAITFFSEQKNSAELKKIHRKIIEGMPIGKAFRMSGYGIRKNVVDVSILKIPNWLKKKFAVESDFAKSRLSEFYAKRTGEEAFVYGLVVEIYSPDFRTPVINKYDESQISALTVDLNNQGISTEEVWRRIGIDNDYHDSQEAFLQAKRDSQEKVAVFKEKILSIVA